jgi:hypothetical protein
MIEFDGDKVSEVSEVFKYKKGSDSMLAVNQDNYNSCNKKNPIKKLEDGDSEFSFDKSGPFFFISGKDQVFIDATYMHAWM